MISIQLSCVSSFRTMYVMIGFLFFFFKQKTAYEMRISDWSSDVCSSDLRGGKQSASIVRCRSSGRHSTTAPPLQPIRGCRRLPPPTASRAPAQRCSRQVATSLPTELAERHFRPARSEETTSALPSLMRNSYDVFFFQKKTKKTQQAR